MSAQADKARRFLDLHVPGEPLLMPNAWDAGSAKLLASLGFEALATTSSGHAATLGRLDGAVTRDEALAHAAAIVAAVDVPVSADLENCFADEPEGVAETIRGARAAGLDARSRISPAMPTNRSTRSSWLPIACAPRPRRHARAASIWC
jgi:2-methylisocitrate lyase-like PEP mutase family enzyme